METLATALAEFERHGPTDVAYLRLHFARFAGTKALLESTRPGPHGRVLDIGAHWLHQAWLYARDGYEVTAADVRDTLSSDVVRRLASANGIRLFHYEDLSHRRVFSGLDDNAFDLILLTEVIEHLAFNPVPLWQEIHRVATPGARIVVTTPNAAGLRSRLRAWSKHAFRGSSGLSVEEILRTPTFGHHWKEYTLAELRRYLLLLSPDFAIHKAVHVEDYHASPSIPARVARVVEAAVPFLRPHLHIEVDMRHKQHGVTFEPRWIA